EPDVDLLKAAAVSARGRANGDGLAVAHAGTRAVLVSVPNDERREPYLEIHKRKDKKDRLVTVIEVLSPINKSPGEEAWTLYRKKQREVLKSKTSLVEIDLLRSGKHTTAAPLAVVKEAGDYNYHVCVHPYFALG